MRRFFNQSTKLLEFIARNESLLLLSLLKSNFDSFEAESYVGIYLQCAFKSEEAYDMIRCQVSHGASAGQG